MSVLVVPMNQTWFIFYFRQIITYLVLRRATQVKVVDVRFLVVQCLHVTKVSEQSERMLVVNLIPKAEF